MRGAKAIAWDRVWQTWPMERGARPPLRGNPQMAKETMGFLRHQVAIERQRAERAELALKLSAAVRHEALTLYADGWSNRRIAEKLKISIHDARRLTR